MITTPSENARLVRLAPSRYLIGAPSLPVERTLSLARIVIPTDVCEYLQLVKYAYWTLHGNDISDEHAAFVVRAFAPTYLGLES